MTTFKNAFYAEQTFAGEPERFDALEIHNTETDGVDHFSVFAHFKDGGTDCLADTETHALAMAYAERIAGQYGFPIYDFAMTTV